MITFNGIADDYPSLVIENDIMVIRSEDKYLSYQVIGILKNNDKLVNSVYTLIGEFTRRDIAQVFAKTFEERHGLFGFVKWKKELGY